MDEREVLKEVKQAIGFDAHNTDWDDQIRGFIKRLSQQLRVRLEFAKEVPEDLEYIIVEGTIKRFNRIGDEGMNSYSQEGQRISYEGILDEYEKDIEAYKEMKKKENDRSFGGSGRAFFV